MAPIIPHVKVESCRNGSLSTAVVKSDGFLGKEPLEDIRLSELGASRMPFTFVVLRDINGVVDEAEPVVLVLNIELVPILLSELMNELLRFFGRILNLDGVRLDMKDMDSSFFQSLPQVDHEQRSPLGHDVVHIPGVSEGIIELGAGKAIHAVDHDLQGV